MGSVNSKGYKGKNDKNLCPLAQSDREIEFEEGNKDPCDAKQLLPLVQTSNTDVLEQFNSSMVRLYPMAAWFYTLSA